MCGLLGVLKNGPIRLDAVDASGWEDIAEHSEQAIALIKRLQGVYLCATGGAAYLLAQSIRAAKVLAFADLGVEAIHEFELDDFPVTVAVDVQGRRVLRVLAQAGGK